MNRIFTTVWNSALGAWVATSECVMRCGKGGASSLRQSSHLTSHAPLISPSRFASPPATGILATSATVTAMALLGGVLIQGQAHAVDLPSGGQVVLGDGRIGLPDGRHLTIDQLSHKLGIDWDSFDIGADHRVTFHQPGADAIALNRVLGADGSTILGQLDANGRVFLLNPNGVLFGPGAEVNVGGLVASTLDLSNEDFAAGDFRFQGDGGNAGIVNYGSIGAADGGAIALLGGTVSNHGTIVANQGSVALAAGDAITLDFAGDGLLNVQVDAAVVDALVENHQLIKADGGQVLLTANAGDALLQTVVNHTGVIEAQTLGERDGRIVLLGDFAGGSVQVAGTLDASAPHGGDGGFIDTSGAHVRIADGTTVTTLAADGRTGDWLIDPTDFTVSAGDAAQSDSGIGAATLSANLASNNIELATVAVGDDPGDIHVDAAVSWYDNTTLTLSAHNDIHLNADITAHGDSAGLVLNHGGHAQNGTAIDGSDYHVKAPVTLGGDNASLAINGQDYTMIRSMADLQTINIDPSGHYALAHSLDASGTTYTSVLVGTSSGNAFNGRFAGLGHTINDLTIDSSGNYVGLFGHAGGGSTIRDIGLLDAEVSGNDYVGGLVGSNSGGSIRNAHATGSVSGGSSLGGLAGSNSGEIRGSHSTASVTNVNSTFFTGGLVGSNSGLLEDVYATGSVTGAQSYTGGLVGGNTGTIRNAYATGNVQAGTLGAGGLVGLTSGASDISNVHASGMVSSSSGGGVIGYSRDSTSELSNAYWDTTSTGQSAAIGIGSASITNVISVTSATRYQHGSYDNFGTWGLVPDTRNVHAATDAGGVQWIMIEGSTRPFLASEYSTTITNAHQLQLMALNLNADYRVTRDIDASVTAGSDPSGMWSTAGFSPIGNSSRRFTGTFAGLGHTIRGLTIARPDRTYVGLFGLTDNGTAIRDIGLVGGSVTGNHYVGGLVGWNYGSIRHVYASGRVEGNDFVGGLAGINNGTNSDSYATGRVEGNDFVGGLVGSNNGTFNDSYATGRVEGNDFVGGLAGYNSGSISNAYATGRVEGNNYIGGLAGYNPGSISNAYATGDVTGGDNYVGGLVGRNQGSISDAFHATTDANGNSINTGLNSLGTGRTWGELTSLDTFAGWDIDDQGGTGTVWRLYEGHTTPLLRGFLTPVTVTANDDTATYDGTLQTSDAGYAIEPHDADLLFGSGSITGGGRDAGTYTLGLDGLWSTQQGYDLIVGEGTLTIAPRPITVSADDLAKVYGEDDPTLTWAVTEGNLVFDDSLDGSLSRDAGNNVGDYTIGQGSLDHGNYAITFDDGTLTITPRAITVSADDLAKVYGEDDPTLTWAVTEGNLVFDDSLDGSLIREAGEDVGGYSIGQGSLENGNYAITFHEGVLTITAVPTPGPEPTPEPSPSPQPEPEAAVTPPGYLVALHSAHTQAHTQAEEQDRSHGGIDTRLPEVDEESNDGSLYRVVDGGLRLPPDLPTR